VAEDAVLIGPVSKPEFPDNREFNREFFKFGPFAAILAPNRPANSIGCSIIPYATEQGIFCRLTGNFGNGTGNVGKGSGNGAGRSCASGCRGEIAANAASHRLCLHATGVHTIRGSDAGTVRHPAKADRLLVTDRARDGERAHLVPAHVAERSGGSDGRQRIMRRSRRREYLWWPHYPSKRPCRRARAASALGHKRP